MIDRGTLLGSVVILPVGGFLAWLLIWSGQNLREHSREVADSRKNPVIFCTADDYSITRNGEVLVLDGVDEVLERYDTYMFQKVPAANPGARHVGTLNQGFNHIFDNDPTVLVVKEFGCPEDMNQTPWTVWR
jgi:hypothetical protein